MISSSDYRLTNPLPYRILWTVIRPDKDLRYGTHEARKIAQEVRDWRLTRRIRSPVRENLREWQDDRGTIIVVEVIR